jgi:hypothetical protein
VACGRGRCQVLTTEVCGADSCTQPRGRGVQRVRCDGCGAWYHWQCVGITSERDFPLNFFCSPEFAVF